MSRTQRPFKPNDDLWDAFQALRKEGQILSRYRSDNAALEAFLFYALLFRRPHMLMLQDVTENEEALIHAFTKFCVDTDLDVRDLLPKPATAKDVLKLAAECRDKAKRPPKK